MSADGLRLKIDWAKKHISDLDSIIHSFNDSRPYEVVAKQDPHTRRMEYSLSRVDPVPDSIPLIAGDIFGNLVSILDHLAYQIFIKANPSGNGRHIYFPIPRSAHNAAEYEAAREGKVKGMPQGAIDAIDAIEPYRGGKGHELWVLSELNNASKHRELIVVASRFGSVDVGSLIADLMGNAWPAEKVPLVLKPADPLCPLKVGDVAFIDLPDAKVDQKLKFAFNVAINEPQITKAQPLTESVHHLANLVDGIVAQLSPFI